MKSSSVTVEILKGIRTDLQGMRDELQSTREELRGELRTTREGLRDELQTTREELSGRIDRLSRRVVESELRTATAISDLAGTVRDMTGVLRAESDLRPRVERCEQDIADIKKRFPA